MPESERDRFHGDVIYEVWRSGGNPDAVDYDCTQSCYSDGIDADACASEEIRRQREPAERRAAEEAAMQEQWEVEQYEAAMEREREEAYDEEQEAQRAQEEAMKVIYSDEYREVRRTPDKKPTKGGACAFYEVHVLDVPGGGGPRLGELDFQHDTIPDVGIQGWTNEAVLAVVIDRLEGFQAGEFACDTNQIALDAARASLRSLELRTKDRKARGVEGKHEA